MENYKKTVQNNKWKIIAKTTWNDGFELPDGSYSLSDIQDYVEDIIKKHKRLTTIPLVHVYINRINNRLVFQIKGHLEQWNYLLAQKNQ